MKEKQSSGEALCEAAKTYIEAHSVEKFSLNGISKALFVNGSYLLRTFKRHTGMTLLCYHHLIRCEKAKEMLLQTNLSVSRIGESVGFISSSHFTHIFRKTENCTPTEYRRLHGPDREEMAEP